jgi:hypothetical protein
MDTLLAGLLVVASSLYLIRKKHPNFVVWIILGTLLGRYLLRLSWSLAAIASIGLVVLITWRSCSYHIERFEDKEKESPKEPSAKDPHVDLGTTIMHAYRNLSPEQITGMRKDTKELMDLQKELMGTLSEMKPAIEQGSQMLASFQTFFGSGDPAKMLGGADPAPSAQTKA